MTRAEQFTEQCITCKYKHCGYLCGHCDIYNGKACNCIESADKDETSCKYYKAKEEMIKVDDFGTQTFDDTKEKTITFKSQSTAYIDAAEKALFPATMFDSTIDSNIRDKVDELEKQVDDLISKVSRLERALNSTTLQLNILLKRFEL